MAPAKVTEVFAAAPGANFHDACVHWIEPACAWFGVPRTFGMIELFASTAKVKWNAAPSLRLMMIRLPKTLFRKSKR